MRAAHIETNFSIIAKHAAQLIKDVIKLFRAMISKFREVVYSALSMNSGTAFPGIWCA